MKSAGLVLVVVDVQNRGPPYGGIKKWGVRNHNGTAKQCQNFRVFLKSAGLVFAPLPPGNNVDDICDGDHPTLFPGGRGAENKTGRFQKLLVSVHAMAENRTGRFR